MALSNHRSLSVAATALALLCVGQSCSGPVAPPPGGVAGADPRKEVQPLTLAASQPISAPSLPFKPVAAPHLPNAYQVTGKVICGGQPDGEPGFGELESLGVKTIISVDGIAPDVELAHRHGMRYVHLPFGYDGVPEQRGVAIAKALADLPGPVYVHCHHGMHRSPAAVAVACVTNGALSKSDGILLLHTMGTGANYTGLWRSAEDARPLSATALAAVQVDYVEQATIPPLTDAMVGVDQALDRLKLARAAGWATPPNLPDAAPSHEALQLNEMLVEISRSDAAKQKPEGFQERLRDCAQKTDALRAVLASEPTNTHRADAAFQRVTQSCAACHNTYRD